MPAPRNREEFAALVNDARRRHYLSIRAVARVAQVPATTIQGWLDGRHFPSPALRPNYLLLVNHLGLDDEVPDDIWDDSRA
ncbi:MAG TPA: helix-turn-helix domain-containing protein [Propionicimonas sp.]|jgi:DNA-binding transcriptional regulator YiaG|uniref:helix-turn-helix domain-containing protein n=1 Tax=Propionicimonas sp. TaxID=1955623 RepID=UPI002F3F959F